jgi:hypothetical protein
MTHYFWVGEVEAHFLEVEIAFLFRGIVAIETVVFQEIEYARRNVHPGGHPRE